MFRNSVTTRNARGSRKEFEERDRFRSQHHEKSSPASLDVRSQQRLISMKDRLKPNLSEDYEKNEENLKKILDSTMINLDDGTKEYVFSRGPLYPNGAWPVQCHVCGTQNLLTKDEIENHIHSKFHTKLIERVMTAATYRRGLDQIFLTSSPYLSNCIRIFPGEKIKHLTPEYHNRILKMKENTFFPKPLHFVCERLLDNEVLHQKNILFPILGICYAYIINTDSHTPEYYYCALCDIDARRSPTVYEHFIGLKHVQNYIEKHFPVLLRRMLQFIPAYEAHSSSKIVHEIVLKIYRNIEEKRGLRQVHLVQLKIGRAKDEKLSKVIGPFSEKIHHYSDTHMLETDEEIKELVSRYSRGENLFETNSRCLIKYEDESKHNKSETKNHNFYEEDRHHSRKRESSREGSKFDDNEKNWDRYRRMVGAALDDLDERYTKCRENPESHPLYEEEWKRFWCKKAEPLEKSGEDPTKFDFKEEWIFYWRDFMRKLHEKSIAKIKFKTKKSLNLPYEKKSPSPIRKRKSESAGHAKKSRSPPRRRSGTPHKRRSHRSVSPSPKKEKYSPPEPPSLHNYREHDMNKHRGDDSQLPLPAVPHSSQSRNESEYRDSKRDKPTSSSTSKRSVSRSSSYSGRVKTPPPPSICDDIVEQGIMKYENKSFESFGVISILRLLTAIEETLGSLGPRAVDLLSRALIFEKDTGKNANELMNEKDFYIFFVTVKEKLKGQLITNILEKSKIAAVNKILDETEQLLEMYEDYLKSNENTRESSTDNNAATSTNTMSNRSLTSHHSKSQEFIIGNQKTSPKGKSFQKNTAGNNDNYFNQYNREAYPGTSNYKFQNNLRSPQLDSDNFSTSSNHFISNNNTFQIHNQITMNDTETLSMSAQYSNKDFELHRGHSNKNYAKYTNEMAISYPTGEMERSYSSPNKKDKDYQEKHSKMNMNYLPDNPQEESNNVISPFTLNPDKLQLPSKNYPNQFSGNRNTCVMQTSQMLPNKSTNFKNSSDLSFGKECSPSDENNFCGGENSINVNMNSYQNQRGIWEDNWRQAFPSNKDEYTRNENDFNKDWIGKGSGNKPKRFR